MAFTVWNSSDISGVVLSGGNLTVTASTTVGGVRTVDGQSSGKFYWECKFTTNGSTWDFGTGIEVKTAPLTLGTSGGNAGPSVSVERSTGSRYINTVSTPLFGAAIATGTTVCCAVDLTNFLIWFRLGAAGNWNNNVANNPATGVGGISFSSLGAGTWYPFAGFSGVASGQNIIANFGGTAFVGAVPAGFTAGWTTPPPPVELAGNLGGSSHYGKLKYGLGKYSRIPVFAPLFSADITIVAPLNLSGGLAPTIVFAADLDVHVNLIDLAGGIAPQIALEGALSLDLPLTALEGGLTPIVVLGASSFVSGPLWAASESCPSPPWAESEPCPPSLWTPIEPCDSVEWSKSELCNG